MRDKRRVPHAFSGKASSGTLDFVKRLVLLSAVYTVIGLLVLPLASFLKPTSYTSISIPSTSYGPSQSFAPIVYTDAMDYPSSAVPDNNRWCFSSTPNGFGDIVEFSFEVPNSTRQQCDTTHKHFYEGASPGVKVRWVDGSPQGKCLVTNNLAFTDQSGRFAVGLLPPRIGQSSAKQLYAFPEAQALTFSMRYYVNAVPLNAPNSLEPEPFARILLDVVARQDSALGEPVPVGKVSYQLLCKGGSAESLNNCACVAPLCHDTPWEGTAGQVGPQMELSVKPNSWKELKANYYDDLRATGVDPEGIDSVQVEISALLEKVDGTEGLPFVQVFFDNFGLSSQARPEIVCAIPNKLP